MSGSEHNLNISITAQDAATAKITALRSRIADLAEAIKTYGGTAYDAGGRVTAKLQEEIELRNADIRALGGQAEAIHGVTTALAEQNAAAVTWHMGLQLEGALGPGLDREIQSAAASARTFASSLSIAAAEDARLRDIALEASIALKAQANALAGAPGLGTVNETTAALLRGTEAANALDIALRRAFTIAPSASMAVMDAQIAHTNKLLEATTFPAVQAYEKRSRVEELSGAQFFAVQERRRESALSNVPAKESASAFEAALGPIGTGLALTPAADFSKLVSDLVGVKQGYLSAAESARVFEAAETSAFERSLGIAPEIAPAAQVIAAARPSRAAAMAGAGAMARGATPAGVTEAESNAVTAALKSQQVAALAVVEALRVAKAAGMSEAEQAVIGANAATQALTIQARAAERAAELIRRQTISGASAAQIIASRTPSGAAADAAAKATIRGEAPAVVSANATMAATTALMQQERAIEAVRVAMVTAKAAGASAAEIEAASIRAATMALAEQGAMAERTGLGGFLQREIRHVVGFFDSIARGQRGQAISSIGAAARDAGLGVMALGTSMGGLVALMSTAAILRGAENMGKWATGTRAAASAAGMSIEKFSQLQGALALMGIKAEEANATLRHLATSLNAADADPTSKQMEALNNLGISQQMLMSNTQGVAGVIRMLADAFVRTADSENKAANFAEILGRNWEQLIPALQGGGAQLDALERKADTLGHTLTEKSAAGLEKTGQAVTELGQRIKGDGISAMEAWGPAIQVVAKALGVLLDVVTGVTNAIGGFVSAVTSIPGVAEDFAQRVIPSYGKAVQGAETVAEHYARIQAEREGKPIPPSHLTATQPDIKALPTPKAIVPPLETPVTVMEAMTERIKAAQLQLAEAAVTAHPSGMKAAERRKLDEAQKQVAIEETERTLAYHPDAPQKVQQELRTKLIEEKLSLTKDELVAPSGGKTAREDYAAFAEGERLKISEAQGSASAITAIYDEWIGAVKGKYASLVGDAKQQATEILRIEREKVQEINKARQQELDETFRQQDQQTRIMLLDARLQVLQTGGGSRADERTQGPSMDLQRAVQARGEAGNVETIARARITQEQQVVDTSPQGSTIQRDAQNKINEILEQSKAQEVALYQRAADETEAAVKKLTQPFTQFFDSLGSQFESFSQSLLTAFLAPQIDLVKRGLTSVKVSEQGNEIRSAFRSIFLSVAGDFSKALENTISQTFARIISGGASNTISDFLSRSLSSLTTSIFPSLAGSATSAITGSATSAVGSTALVAAGTTLNTAGVGLNTAQVGLNTAAVALSSSAAALTASAGASGVGAASGAPGLVTSLFGLFSEGGIVPSAAMGMVVPSAAGGMVVGQHKHHYLPSAAGGMVSGGLGGTLAILHPNEMVLPSPISQSIQTMVSRNNTNNNASTTANLNFAPTINAAGRGRGGTGLSRGEFMQMLSLHSGSMLGEARNMIRNGWRPA